MTPFDNEVATTGTMPYVSGYYCFLALYRHYGIDADGVASTVRQILGGKEGKDERQ